MTTRHIAGAAGAILLLGVTFAFGDGAGHSAAVAEFGARPTPAPRIITRIVTKTIKVPVTKIVTRTVIKAVTVAAPTAAPTSEPEATAAPAESSGVTYNGVTVAKTQIVDDSSGDVAPDAGKQYVTVHVTIANNSDQNYDYNVFDFKLQDDNNTLYSGGAMDTNVTTTALGSGTLAPGRSAAGDLAFEVPADLNSFGLLWTPTFDAPAQDVPMS